jgi:hypothetical protein
MFAAILSHVPANAALLCCRFLVGSEPGAAGVGTRHLYQLRQSLENGPPSHVDTDSQRPENGSHHVECLTCNSSCEYSDIYLSKDNSYYLLHCLGPQVPYLQVSFTFVEKSIFYNLCLRFAERVTLLLFVQFSQIFVY